MRKRENFYNVIEETLESITEEICEKYCKYHDQYVKDEEEERRTGKNKTYEKHCKNCPILLLVH